MDVNLERKASALADALDQAIEGMGGEGRAAFGFENIAPAGVALQLTQGAQLVTADRVRGRLAVLGAANVQCSGAIKFDLGPFQIANLDGAQPVSVGHEDQSRVTRPIAALAGGSDKRFDLRWREILARAQFAVAGPCRSPPLRAN